MLKQSVKSEAFETIFNVITPPVEQKKVGVEEPDAGRAEARMLELSTKQQRKNRGVQFYFSPKIESQLEEYLDRQNNINFGGLRGDRVPLLDVFGLSSLITKMMIRLEEIASS